MLQIKNGQLIHADCLDAMRKMPDDSFKAIVTSPPYNLRNSSGGQGKGKKPNRMWKTDLMPVEGKGGYSDYDDNMPHDQYVAWQRDVISECIRLLTPDGAFFYNHKWRIQNGRLQERYDITHGFPLRQIIIWERPGAIPQGHYKDGVMCFVPNIEVIYMFAKSKQFRIIKGKHSAGLVWRFAPARGNPHSAPFPLELPMRCISSVKGHQEGKVLDPFLGSGTTAVAAERLGCEWVGIEHSKEYCEMAAERIENDTQ